MNFGHHAVTGVSRTKFLIFLLLNTRHSSVYGLPKSVWAGERLQVNRILNSIIFLLSKLAA